MINASTSFVLFITVPPERRSRINLLLRQPADWAQHGGALWSMHPDFLAGPPYSSYYCFPLCVIQLGRIDNFFSLNAVFRFLLDFHNFIFLVFEVHVSKEIVLGSILNLR